MSSMKNELQKVLGFIDRKKKELVNLSVTMGNIQSPTGFEKHMVDFVIAWLKNNGFKTIEQKIS